MNSQLESSLHTLESLLTWAIADADCQADNFCVRAIEVLREWDGLAMYDSVGALLFDRWRATAVGGPGTGAANWEVPFNLADPIETPRGIAPPAAAAAVAALGRVAREMEEEDGQPLTMAWGEFKKLPLDNNGIEWGVSGTQDDSVRNSHTSRRPAIPGATDTGFAGGTFKSVNEFVPGGASWGRAAVQTAYGSQTMRGAAHNSDQWEIYSRNQYRTALLDRADIEAAAERRVTLSYAWPGRSNEQPSAV